MKKTEEDTNVSAVASSDTGKSVMNPTAGKNWKLFDVCPETFSKFNTGRNKFERWSRYLNTEDEGECAVADYARTNRTHTVVLRCSETGALRAIRKRSACGL